MNKWEAQAGVEGRIQKAHQNGPDFGKTIVVPLIQMRQICWMEAFTDGVCVFCVQTCLTGLIVEM